jgi:chromosome segregation ATPase
MDTPGMMSISTLSSGALPSMPSIPSSVLGGGPAAANAAAGEEQQEAAEEQKLLNILLRLKTAQSSADQSRKRKHQQEVATDTIRTFKQQRKVLLDRHNKRWQGRLQQLHARCDQLQLQVRQSMNELDAEMQECQAALRAHETEIRRIEGELQALEQDTQHLHRQAVDSEPADRAEAHRMVLGKLAELRELLQRTRASATKEDKFSRMIKQFVTSMC